jgi:hypothetical protein
MLLEKTKESIYNLLDSLRLANVYNNIMFSTDSVNKKKGVVALGSYGKNNITHTRTWKRMKM